MRFDSALLSFGNPQEQLPAVIVGGTNGKSSIASHISRRLFDAGYRVGLFTSPHLFQERERIRVNGEAISESTLQQLRDEIAKKNVGSLNFFEEFTLIAMLYFKKQRVDFSVFEVGLGGRLDPTNRCRPVLSIMTNVGSDHLEELGPTLEDVLMEKVCIARRGVPFVIGELSPNLHMLADNWCKAHQVPAYFQTNSKEKDFDRRNVYFAERCLEHLAKQAPRLRGRPFSQFVLRPLPARWQRVRHITIDMAHNDDAFAALHQMVKKPFDLAVAKPKGKRWGQNFLSLAKSAERLLLVSIDDSYFLPAEELRNWLVDTRGTFKAAIVKLEDLPLGDHPYDLLICGSIRLAEIALRRLEVDTSK